MTIPSMEQTNERYEMGQNQNPPKQPRNVQTGSNLRVAMHLTLPFLVTRLAVVVLGAAYSPKADSPGSLAGRADFLDSGGDLCSQESGAKCCDPYTCTRIMSSLSTAVQYIIIEYRIDLRLT